MQVVRERVEPAVDKYWDVAIRIRGRNGRWDHSRYHRKDTSIRWPVLDTQAPLAVVDRFVVEDMVVDKQVVADSLEDTRLVAGIRVEAEHTFHSAFVVS